jgi:Flp pilus assembly protein TadD
VQEYKNALSLAVRRSFTPEDIKKIAVSVLEILVDLQKRTPPVIHRDIKPENILVDKQLNAYLVDFGFARIRTGELALSSVAAGTPGFMPPEEQFGRPLTEASDLYSLGATLICLLTGTRSLDVGNLIDDNYRFDFKGNVPQLSPRFVQWLTKVVEPNLKNRYANAAVALEALKPIQVVRANQSRKTALVVGLASLSIILIGKTWIFSERETAINSIDNSNPSFVTSTPTFQEDSSDSNKAIPFHISSMNDSFFAMVGTFDGNYRVYPDFIEVNVTKATLYLRDSTSYKEREELNSVTFSLGTDRPKGWDTLNKSQSLPVNKVMKPGDTYTFNSTRFLIPKNGSTDLSKHWLVVEMEVTSLDGEYAGTSPGYTYAHSQEDIFSSLDTTVTQSTDASLYEAADLVKRSRKLADQGGYSQALPLVDKALELYPDDSEAWADRCWILDSLKRYREALESCNRALQFNPDSAWSWGRRGRILLELGQSQEALIALDKSLKITPDDDWVLTWRGLALNKLGRYQEALTFFEKALAINPAPNYSWSWYGKGIALEELGRKKEALASYEKAIKGSPRWQQAINKRNQLQSQMASFK